MINKKYRASLVVSVALLGGVHAQIELRNSSITETPTKTWTVTDLNNTPPAVSSGSATGTLTGAGGFEEGQAFSLTASGVYGWSTAGAQTSTNDFGTYLSSLTVVGIGAISGAPFGVDSRGAAEDSKFDGMSGTAEALVLTVDTGGLSAEAVLVLQSILLVSYDSGERADFLVYDVSADRVVEAQWNADYNSSSDRITGSWTLDDGDQIIIATGTGNGSWWRIYSLTLDATQGSPDIDPPTPNPATWDSVPTADSAFSINMTATTGVDSNAVEYLFEEISANPGGTDSGWQSDPSYTDSGLYPSTQYRYTVIMRDAVGNTGTVSSVAYVTTPEVAGRTNGPPNVVIIYADDLGHADISCNAAPGSLVHTPNIDRICYNGIYFDNYMTHHVCSPSRAGLITGRHYTEVGSGVETGGVLDNSIPNIAKDFKAAGYATGAFGKWHNGNPPYSDDGSIVAVDRLSQIIKDDLIMQALSSDNFGEGVNAYGFDDWAGYYGGGFDYHNRIGKRDVNWWSNGTYSAGVQGYNTDIIRDNALNFIDAHAHEPFFLYVPMEAVHGPYDILNTDLIEMCDIWDDLYPSLAWSAVGELISPTTGNKIKDVLQMRCSDNAEFDRNVLDLEIPGYRDLVYYTMAHSMDKATGLILDRLDAYGLSTNTIVVFASDNGGVNEDYNIPFRGTKHTIWEGGVHVPAAIWWPEHLDANQAPYTPADNWYTNMTQYFDWYPTLIHMAGQTVTAAELDGINLYPHLQARTPARPDLENCYYGLDDTWATIRSDRWKLHFNRVQGNQVLELYDMYSDVSETTNVQASYPVERDALIGLLDEWFATADVTASYMPLTGESLPLYTQPAPSGDILEITAVQTRTLSDTDSQGLYIHFASPDKDSTVHAADMLIYDIYVAEDSDHLSGMFCSPSFGASDARFNSKRGVHTNEVPLASYVLPKGQWVRMMSGMGEIAINVSSASFIGLHNPLPGTYHFYIDNLSIRKKDGTLRGVSWDNGSDTRGGLVYYAGGIKYTSYSTLENSPDNAFSSIDFSTVNLSNLPGDLYPELHYNDWASSIGGGIEAYNPAGPGPINNWPIVMEYGLGSDPNTYTAGLQRGTNYPTSGELGTYAFRDLFNTNYMTLTFDFNREARDVEIVVAESSNLVDWVDAVVLSPPYSDTSVLATNDLVLAFEDNQSGYPVNTTRVTAQGSVALDNASQGFLKLVVRPVVAAPDTPASLVGALHDGVLLEWSGAVENGEYIIERAASGSGAYAELARTGGRLYTDTTAVSGQTYDYRVRAVNVAGATSWSNMATITR